MLGKKNRPRDRRKRIRERREEMRRTARGRKKEVPSKRQTVPAPSSQWVWGARIPGSSEEVAESLPPSQGNRTWEHREGHMANHRAGSDSVKILRNPTSREEGNSQEE